MRRCHCLLRRCCECSRCSASSSALRFTCKVHCAGSTHRGEGWRLAREPRSDLQHDAARWINTGCLG